MRSTSTPATADVEIQVLSGALVVIVAGTRTTLTSPLQRQLLTALVIADGASVSRVDLIESLWADQRAGDADNLLSSHVGRLRRVLDRAASRAGSEGSVIPRSNRGYRIDLDRVDLDLSRLRRVLEDLRRDPTGEESVEQAYALLETLRASGGRDDGLQPLLDEAWRTARHLCELLVAAGPGRRWGRLEGYLSAARERAPFDEQVAAWWLAALAETGRVGEALTEYPVIAASLRDELGSQPGPELTGIHRALLARATDDRDDAVRETSGPVGGSPEGPSPYAAWSGGSAETGRQGAPTVRAVVAADPPMSIPVPPTGFAGRARALAQLAELAGGPQPGYGPRTVVITGPAGVGKSALVLAGAAQVGRSFPDGRVYLDFAAADRLLDPSDVVVSLLVSLGEDPATLPTDHGGLLARLRVRTAGRRMLLVLDNVGPLDPVAELVPNAPDSLLLLTCRTAHPDLLGAPRLDLGPLTVEECLELMAPGVSAARRLPDAELADLVELTEGRPVAVRVCAQLLVNHPGWTVRRLIDRLADAERRFDVFSHVERGLAAVFDEATKDLAPLAGDVLDATGLLALAQVEPWMVAAVLDVDADDALEALDDLTAVRLIDDATDEADDAREPAPSVFAVSSLLRTFAGRRWRDRGAEPSAAAVERYVTTLINALHRRQRGDRVGGAADPVVDAAIVRLPESTLVAAVELAGRHGLVTACAELARLLGSTLFADRNSFGAWRHTHDHALEQLRAARLPAAEAGLALGVARLHLAREQFADAEAKLAEADRIAAAAGATRIRAEVRVQQATLWAETHRSRRAIDVLDGGWLADAEVDARVRAEGYRQRAAAHRDLGEFADAVADADAAYAIFLAEGDRIGEGLSLRSRGLNHLAVGEYAEAARLGMAAEDALLSVGARLLAQYAAQLVAKARFRAGTTTPSPALVAAREVCAELHDDFGQALMLRTLGEEAMALGELTQAREYLEWSLKMWLELGLPGWQARTLRDLADCVRRQGDLPEAGVMREAALITFGQLGLREADELRGSAS